MSLLFLHATKSICTVWPIALSSNDFFEPISIDYTKKLALVETVRSM